MSGVSKEEIANAYLADIVAVCFARGEKMQVLNYNEGKYKIKGEGGLCVWNHPTRGGEYCLHTGGTKHQLNGQNPNDKNTVITFCMVRYGMSFVEAVRYLNQPEFQGKSITKHYLREKITYSNFQNLPVGEEINNPAKNNDKIIHYLSAERKINKAIIQEFLDTRLLYQDKRNNAVFVCKNDKGDIIGYEIKGTVKDKPFKMCKGNAVFTFQCGSSEPKGVIAFESAIDLMSYYELHKEKLTHHLLLSMGGCRYEILEQVLNSKTNDFIVAIATDDDKVGNEFIDIVRKQKPNHKIVRLKPKNNDWNDDLKKTKKQTKKDN